MPSLLHGTALPHTHTPKIYLAYTVYVMVIAWKILRYVIMNPAC